MYFGFGYIFSVCCQFSVQPGDRELVGIVGYPLTIPCVLDRIYPDTHWVVEADITRHIIITSISKTILNKYAHHYQLAGGGGKNFSLQIQSVRLSEPQLHCVVENPRTRFSTSSRISVIGE